MDLDTDTVFPRSKIGRDHQLRDVFRNGKVIERKHDPNQGPLVRVQFLDKQGTISDWFPVKQFGSRKTMHYYCPKIGDDVCVNMLPNGSEKGFVDGSFFNASNPPPPGIDLDTRRFQTEDGTVIEYRENDSTLSIQSEGPINIVCQLVNFLVSGDFNLTCGVLTITAGTIVMTAPAIVLNGNIVHNGNMSTSGVHTDANGIHQ